MSKFQCNYPNCKRVLNSERVRSFKCSMCGHGIMRLVPPKTSCSICDSPIYGNVDTNEGADVTCADCTSELLEGKPVDENTRRGKSFSERIGAARKRLKWTQGQVAEYLGFKTKVTITRYEKGLRYPRKTALEKVLKWIREIEGLQRSEIQEWLQGART